MMNRQNERSIERYLNGGMTPSEKEEFFSRLEADPTLRAMLGTDRAIRASMVSDRNAIPSDHARTRERTLALAASTPPDGERVSNVGIARKMSTGMKAFIGTMVGIAVTAGAILLPLPGDDRSTSPQPTISTAPGTSPAPPAASAVGEKAAPGQRVDGQTERRRPSDLPVTGRRSNAHRVAQSDSKPPTASGSPGSPAIHPTDTGTGRAERVTVVDRHLRTKVEIEIPEKKP